VLDLELVLEPQHVRELELEDPAVTVARERPLLVGEWQVAGQPDGGEGLVGVVEAERHGHPAAT
jgi:hypothetical protein